MRQNSRLGLKRGVAADHDGMFYRFSRIKQYADINKEGAES